jgi:hypothetical protein
MLQYLAAYPFGNFVTLSGRDQLPLSAVLESGHRIGNPSLAKLGAYGETRPELRVHRARTINTITRITTIVPAKP